MPASYDASGGWELNRVYPTRRWASPQLGGLFLMEPPLMALFYNQSRRRNIQYSAIMTSTMIDVLVTKPPTVLIPGYSTFCP